LEQPNHALRALIDMFSGINRCKYGTSTDPKDQPTIVSNCLLFNIFIDMFNFLLQALDFYSPLL